LLSRALAFEAHALLRTSVTHSQRNPPPQLASTSFTPGALDHDQCGFSPKPVGDFPQKSIINPAAKPLRPKQMAPHPLVRLLLMPKRNVVPS